jgi:hypothetical protein
MWIKGVTDADVDTTSVVSMLRFFEVHVVLSVHNTEIGLSAELAGSHSQDREEVATT